MLQSSKNTGGNIKKEADYNSINNRPFALYNRTPEYYEFIPVFYSKRYLIINRAQ